MRFAWIGEHHAPWVDKSYVCHSEASTRRACVQDKARQISVQPFGDSHASKSVNGAHSAKLYVTRESGPESLCWDICSSSAFQCLPSHQKVVGCKADPTLCDFNILGGNSELRSTAVGIKNRTQVELSKFAGFAECRWWNWFTCNTIWMCPTSWKDISSCRRFWCTSCTIYVRTSARNRCAIWRNVPSSQRDRKRRIALAI